MPTLNKFRDFLRQIFKELSIFFGEPQDNIRGIKIMYIVKADNPEVGFTLSFDTFDSEGNVVPEETLMVEVVSDNEDAVSVSYANEAGTVRFGNPGLANLNVTVETAGGELLGSFGAQFTVTVGDPASISSGTIAFEGLTEAPVDEPIDEDTGEEILS